MRRDKAGRRLEVQLLYPVRCSEPPGPRVMGVCSRGQGLSVDRGKHRLGIELRNQGWECRPCWVNGKAKRPAALDASSVPTERANRKTPTLSGRQNGPLR